MDKNRILEKVFVAPNSCWLWEGSTSSAGYGQLTDNGRYWGAHRYSYTVFVGDIPEGLLVRHKCHNPLCCNPAHLSVGTSKDNWKDSEDLHRKHHIRLRKTWKIDGECYPTCRVTSEQTGVCLTSIVKFTENGVFNIARYREGCKIANVAPKV